MGFLFTIYCAMPDNSRATLTVRAIDWDHAIDSVKAVGYSLILSIKRKR